MSGHRIGPDGQPAIDHHPLVGLFLRLFDRLNGTPPVAHATREEVLELRRRQLDLTSRVRAVEARLKVMRPE